MPQPAPKASNSRSLGDLSGTIAGRFAVIARLGVGGMGEVYRANDIRLERAVALKRIAPRLQSDEDYRNRFLREARYASRLNHPCIGEIHDVFEVDDELLLVMEYVDGETLRQRFARPLNFAEFFDIAVQCADGLSAAHDQGIVHGDIKPENIMLRPNGHIKILDFGLAKELPRLDDEVTAETLGNGTRSGGTLAYMAPEVLLEQPADHRTDIFSLGVVLYEALGGSHPFRSGGAFATANKILQQAPAQLHQLNPKVMPEQERIIAKMLAKDPAERYATAADLLVDLRLAQRDWANLASPRQIPAPAISRWPARTSNRTRTFAIAGVLSLAAVGALVGVVKHFARPAPISPSLKNVAVLALNVVGGSAEDKAFADGITDSLTAKLTQMTAAHSIQVISAADVRSKHISKAEDARKEYGAQLVLEGSVQHSGGMVRVIYALVDTTSHSQLNADTIDAPVTDPFGLQDRVAIGIAKMLDLELTSQERDTLQNHGTQIAVAYDLFLRGKGFLQSYDQPGSVDNAIHAFEQALSLDRNYSLAFAGLGSAYLKKYDAQKESGWIELAGKSCQKALDLDSQLAAGHVCLGTLRSQTGQDEAAVHEFQKALNAEPTSDEAYRGLGMAYQHLNRFTDAELTYRKAIEVRPQYWAGYSWLGGFYFRQARYAEAEDAFKKVAALIPDSFLGYSSLGAIYVQTGRYDEANQQLTRSISIRPTYSACSNFATLHYHQRKFAQAADEYEQALKLDSRDYRVWGNLGDAHYWTPGNRDAASSAYRKAITLVKEGLRVDPRDPYLLSNLAAYEAMVGERAASLDALQKALDVAPGDSEVRFRAAVVHNQFADTNATLGWLERAVSAGYSTAKVKDSPNFDALKSSPRYQHLFPGKNSP